MPFGFKGGKGHRYFLASHHINIRVILSTNAPACSNLLSAVSYAPETDIIIFAGDVMAKSTHSGSLAVLDFITQHKCESIPGKVYAVRGNHDQMVVQWRAWRDWFEPLQLSSVAVHNSKPEPLTVAPVLTGREFLDLLEAEWEHDRSHDPKGSADPTQWADTARKRASGTWQEEWWRRVPRPGKGRYSKDWAIFEDHYWLAKDMTQAQKECLYSIPLVLHVPSEHFFVVHAGILPSDPKRPATDESQPLAHPPIIYSDPDADHEDPDEGEVIIPFSSGAQQALGASTGLGSRVLPRKNETLERLRTAQESAILSEIPDNRDPWVLLNMRGIRRKKGKVTRQNDKGTPWSKVWNAQIGRCVGYDNSSGSSLVVPADNDDAATVSLPCEPATIVYGHAATRGLDVKRWSVGIDTGCLYGRKLTTLILQRPKLGVDKSIDDVPADDGDDDDELDEDDDDDEVEDDDLNSLSRFTAIADRTVRTRTLRKPPKNPRTIKFGDDDAGIKASLVSVQCPEIAD